MQDPDFELTVEARLDQMARRIDALEAENQRLKDSARGAKGPSALGPAAPTDQPADDDAYGERADLAVSRRGLLLGAAGAAAVGVTAMVATATPAAADTQGQALTIGGANSETATTTLTTTLNSAAAVHVTNSSTMGSGIIGTAGTPSGLPGRGAVIGDSTQWPAVLGLTKNAYGVQGVQGTYPGSISPPPTAGVYGVSEGNYGVVGLCNAFAVAGFGDLVGVWGNSDTGTAVMGNCTAGGTAAAFSSDGPQITVGPVSNNRLAPTNDTSRHYIGEIIADSNGGLWYCVAPGNPGLWRNVAGADTAGSLHLLPTPVRVYDSRPLTSPSTGPKTPLAANTSRTIDLTGNSSGVPAGATGAMVTCLLLNAVAGNGNFTVWANGASKPASNTMVWGGSDGRFSTTATTALDATAKCQVNSSIQTDVAIDVVGYYH